MKIKNTRMFYTGLFVFIVQVLVLLRYLRTGCISMPQVPDVCGANAWGALVGVFLFSVVGLFLITVGAGLIKNTKEKD